MFDTMIMFLKEILKRKKSADDKSMKNYPACKEIKFRLQLQQRYFLLFFHKLSKRSPDSLAGRNDNGIKVIIPNQELQFDDGLRLPKSGDYIVTQVCYKQ